MTGSIDYYVSPEEWKLEAAVAWELVSSLKIPLAKIEESAHESAREALELKAVADYRYWVALAAAAQHLREEYDLDNLREVEGHLPLIKEVAYSAVRAIDDAIAETLRVATNRVRFETNLPLPRSEGGANDIDDLPF